MKDMYLASIASGSSGNCICVGKDDSYYLIDAGVSKKRIVQGLSEMSIKPEQIRGLFLTHEHNDHISGLGVFLRKYPVPVFATGKTIDAILSCGTLGRLDSSLFHSLEADHPISFDGIRVEASRIYHDAADPVCYSFSDGESRVGIATDFGTFDDYLVEKMSGCRSLLVEANHDLNMLMTGPYPYPLKRRISGNQGHLSNERAGNFLSKIIGRECRQVFLGHLSQHNNYSQLAYETVRLELLMRNMDPDQLGIDLQVAERNQPTFSSPAVGLLEA